VDEAAQFQLIPGPVGRERLAQQCWELFLDGAAAHATAAVNERLRDVHDLTLRDVLLLELLDRPDRRAHRIRALAQRLQVSPSAVAGQIRRLEDRGLITRSPSSRDRRGVLPRLTNEGAMRLYAVLEACGVVVMGTIAISQCSTVELMFPVEQR
jgi:DNA-binding MarR family transcriptional regulator